MSEKKRPKPSTAWSRKWNENHLERIYITVPKGLKTRIQAHATRNKETVNGMIGRLLRRELGLSDEEWTKQNGET